MTTTSSPTVHWTSLIDLTAYAHESTPEEIYNIALLTIMGRLRIPRACVLQNDGRAWSSVHGLCKGVQTISIPPEHFTGICTSSATTARHTLQAQDLEYVVPITSNTSTVAILALGMPLGGVALDDAALQYLEIARRVIGVAVANAEMVQTIRVAKKELEARNLLVTSLFESARDFTSLLTRDELLRMMSFRVMGQLMVNSVAMFLSKPLDGEHIIVTHEEGVGLQSLYPEILECRQPSHTPSFPDNHPMKQALIDARVAMIAPITLHGEHCGVLAVRPKLSGRSYTDDELKFLESIGNAAFSAIENSRLVDAELEKQRLESELAIAASIQRGLLPEKLPVVRGFDIAANAKPSKQIGGDYYDVIRVDEERTLLVIADVAGKGIPAALLMANVQAAMTVLSSTGLVLTELVSRLNTLVWEHTSPEIFVTLWVGEINSRTGTLEYVNAGHNPPVLVGHDRTEHLTNGGLLLGVVPSPAYTTGEHVLQVGDVLALYTDGVTEARVDLEEYGIERLEDVLTRDQDLEAKEILASVLADVDAFAGEQIAADDTSIVVCKYVGT